MPLLLDTVSTKAGHLPYHSTSISNACEEKAVSFLLRPVDQPVQRPAMSNLLIHKIGSNWQANQSALLPAIINKSLQHTHNRCRLFDCEIIYPVNLLSDYLLHNKTTI
jgi:hypothetical protein